MCADQQSLNPEKHHYRTLLLQEKRRVAHLSMINEVQRCILSVPDFISFLPKVAQILVQHFPSCDVVIYLAEPLPNASSTGSTFEATADLKLAASAGNHGLVDVEAGQYADVVLRAARTQHTVCRGFTAQIGSDCEKLESQSQPAAIAIPLSAQNASLGILKLTSNDVEAIDAADVTVLQMTSTALATRIESCLAHAEVRHLGAFQQQLFSNMLHSLLVVDDKGDVCSANERFCQTMGLAEKELQGVNICDILDSQALKQSGLMDALQDTTENGIPHELDGVQLSPPSIQLQTVPFIFDIRIFRVFYRHKPRAVLLFIDLTSHWRAFHRLQLMSEIGRYFSASLDIDTVLRTVLTCITAGNGLGFNRAFLLLVDEKTAQLKGTLALGASTVTEALTIWQELSKNEWDLQQILDVAENVPESLASSPLQKEFVELEIDLNNPLLPGLQQSLDERRTLRVSLNELLPSETPNQPIEADEYRAQKQRAAALFTATEMVVAPLLAKDRVVGVVLADNVFSGSPIEDTDVQLLESLAGQAGLTIDNAKTYQDLQKAQKELVNSERLAVVGDMTARLSHEIRNPLTTIGGFARRLCKHPHNVELVLRNASVIVDETVRLEGLLEDLLEMTRPTHIELQLQHVTDVIDQALLLIDTDLKTLDVKAETDYDPMTPQIQLDRARLLQAFLNILRNGAQSMTEGGILRITTKLKNPHTIQIRIIDTGKGIAPNTLKHLFDPFYSTKIKGSGLGLAITWQIIQDHGGEIEVESEINKGTTFTISLPVSVSAEQ